LRTSRIPGFYKMPPEKRLLVVKEFAHLTDEEVQLLKSMSGLSMDRADRMIENVVGGIPLPLGIATNFLINGKDYLIPMAIEEPSVVAAASHAAKLARPTGGFKAFCMKSIMIGQIQVLRVKDPTEAKKLILAAKEEMLNKANEMDPTLLSLGGGAKDLRVKTLNTIRGPMLILELLVDCKDAMGANVVNTMAEAVSPTIERLTGGKVCLRIVSNLATERLARSEVVIDKNNVGGEEGVDGILDAFAFALADPYRAATHNKGIMNGIIAVALATGNDTRALEAGAHAYAAMDGGYKPLSTWEKDDEGNLFGKIELPIAVGIVGGATHHPIAKVALKILGVKSANELSCVLASVGLAQNLAALRALVLEGIQRGHMKLHARSIAMAVGARGDLVDLIAERLVKEKKIRMDRARELLRELAKT
jgi:hydroxymethylglutaryl-CoA reductase